MAKKTENYWDKRALKRLDDAEKMSEEYIKRVKRIYDKAFKDIEKDIESVYRNYSKNTGLDVQKLKELLSKKETDKVWKTLKRQGLDKYIKQNYKARISRLEKVQAQIYAKAKLIYPKEELEQTMCYRGVVNDSYYKAVYDTQMGTGHNFSFSKIDDNLMTTLLNERWSGKNYSQIIWGNTDILADSLSEVLGGALMSGQSIQKTAREIKERFGVSKYYAERLIRTETNHFHNMADAMAYEDMGVEYYVFVATLDNRTSEICQSMDGKKFAYKDKEEGVNFPPLHPNCRSKTRGYLGEEAEKTLQRRARNLVTGKNEVIDNMTYKEWLDKQKIRYGDDTVSGIIKRTKNKASDKKQHSRYVKRLGRDRVGTLENFTKIKYNNSESYSDLKRSYKLKRHYDKSINDGNLSALVDFDSYVSCDKEITQRLHNVTTTNNVTTKDHSLHFIDRVFGSIEKKRSGVEVDDIKQTLLTSKNIKFKEDSMRIYGDNLIVSVNHKTGKLIQTNPYKK